MIAATCVAAALEKRRPRPVYAVLARLPRPLLISLAATGHRVMEARHLRGIQRRNAVASGERSVGQGSWRKALLACGIVSSLLYGAMIWVIRYEGYSLVSHVPSELTAIGAPTRPLWMWLGSIYTVLVTAFGWGVWQSAGRNRAVRILGALILAYASLGLLWPFAPMHQREVLAVGGGTLSDTLHVVLGGVTVFLTFLVIGVGAKAFGARSRACHARRHPDRRPDAFSNARGDRRRTARGHLAVARADGLGPRRAAGLKLLFKRNETMQTSQAERQTQFNTEQAVRIRRFASAAWRARTFACAPWLPARSACCG